jgi:putative spermidine/putrescine transport system substrate-binding protein
MAVSILAATARNIALEAGSPGVGKVRPGALTASIPSHTQIPFDFCNHIAFDLATHLIGFGDNVMPTNVASPALRPSRPVLRVIGTSSTLVPSIVEQAEKDLGIQLQVRVLNGTEAHRAAVLSPQTYDIYDQWFHNLEIVWAAASLQPIDTRRLPHWSEVGDIGSSGKLVADPPRARGSSPNALLYVQPDGQLGAAHSNFISMMPVSHGAEAFGYRLKDRPPSKLQEDESWAWLLDPEFRGAVLQDNASVGVMDVILAVEAAGLLHFADPTNLSISEIDQLMKLLLELRRLGQFSGTWSTPEHLASLIGRRHVRIFSLWTSALGQPGMSRNLVRAATPKEGFRGWYGGMGLSRYCIGSQLDTAYRYLNWWLDGWPINAIARQGYFYSTHSFARKHMDPTEYGYWFMGKSADKAVYFNQGTIAAQPGETRSGGDYASQIKRIAVWNSVMDEHNYISRRWSDFLLYRN